MSNDQVLNAPLSPMAMNAAKPTPPPSAVKKLERELLKAAAARGECEDSGEEHADHERDHRAPRCDEGNTAKRGVAEQPEAQANDGYNHGATHSEGHSGADHPANEPQPARHRDLHVGVTLTPKLPATPAPRLPRVCGIAAASCAAQDRRQLSVNRLNSTLRNTGLVKSSPTTCACRAPAEADREHAEAGRYRDRPA